MKHGVAKPTMLPEHLSVRACICSGFSPTISTESGILETQNVQQGMSNVTCRADKCEVQWVEEQNNILLSNVLRKLNLQIKGVYTT
jgi:hypothetical protein